MDLGQVLAGKQRADLKAAHKLGRENEKST